MGDKAAHNEKSVSTGELVGRFYAWWHGDQLPQPPSVPDSTMASSENASLVTNATGMGIEAVRERMDRGHRPWVAWIDGEPAGSGWIATHEAGISELGIAITLAPGERYLWDFVTLPAWQGRGVYTALLHAILERDGAERYWIGHDEGNVASARGIMKAGFRQVGTAQRMGDGRIAFVPDEPANRADAAAELLGLPVLRDSNLE